MQRLNISHSVLRDFWDDWSHWDVWDDSYNLKLSIWTQWIWEFDIAAADLMLITTAVETELIDHAVSLLCSAFHISLETSSVDIRQIYRVSEDVDWDADNSEDCWREIKLSSINVENEDWWDIKDTLIEQICTQLTELIIESLTLIHKLTQNQSVYSDHVDELVMNLHW